MRYAAATQSCSLTSIALCLQENCDPRHAGKGRDPPDDGSWSEHASAVLESGCKICDLDGGSISGGQDGFDNCCIAHIGLFAADLIGEDHRECAASSEKLVEHRFAVKSRQA